MAYTVGQAAKATGRSKPTISRAIKTGAISATKNDNGSYTIDPAELHRVFPPKSLSSDDTGDFLRSETPALQATLQREIELLRERLADKDTVIDDLRQRLDAEGEERRRLTAILTDQREKPIITPPPSPAAPPARQDTAPAAVKVLAAKKAPAKEANWLRRMLGGR